MPVETRWYDAEETIMLAEFREKWTIAEFSLGVDVAQRLVESKSFAPYGIADASTSAGIPQGSNLLPHMKRLFRLNFGHVVMVGGSSFALILIRMLVRLNPHWQERLSFADSREAALDRIAKMKVEKAKSP